MDYHVLNGDGMLYSFEKAAIPGEIVVCREALMDGSLEGVDLPSFWKTRAETHGVSLEEYKKVTIIEFEKLMTAPAHSIFHLWFEFDLFCQVNLWFVLDLLNQAVQDKEIHVVYTLFLDRNDPNFWNGYGPATDKDLRYCFDHRLKLTGSDIVLASNLWKSYKKNDLETLKMLSTQSSNAFPYLKEVVAAHLDRFGRPGQEGKPEKVLKEIIQTISPDFEKVFREFYKRESIYGFGDLQLKKLYDKVMEEL